MGVVKPEAVDTLLTVFSERESAAFVSRRAVQIPTTADAVKPSRLQPEKGRMSAGDMSLSSQALTSPPP